MLSLLLTGLINPALMMIPTSVISSSQQQQVQKLNSSPLLQTTSTASPLITHVNVSAAATHNAPIHKDLNENNSFAYNANLLHQMAQQSKQQTMNTSLSNGHGHISPDMNSCKYTGGLNI